MGQFLSNGKFYNIKTKKRVPNVTINYKVNIILKYSVATNCGTYNPKMFQRKIRDY